MPAKTLGASPEDQWVAVTVDKQLGMLTRRYQYLNENLEVRATRSEPTDFDVRERPWYSTASLSVEAQTTDIYRFSQLGAFGQTVSKRIPQTRTVIGIDMTLWGLSNYLNRQMADSEAISFVFQGDGQIVATSVAKPLLASADLIAISGDPYRQDQMVEVSHEGSPHFAYVTPLASREGTSSYFGVLVPQAAVVGTFLGQGQFVHRHHRNFPRVAFASCRGCLHPLLFAPSDNLPPKTKKFVCASLTRLSGWAPG